MLYIINVTVNKNYFIISSNKEFSNLRNVEKLRSAEAVLIGKAARIISSDFIVG